MNDNVGENDKLNEKQENAINMLVAGKPIDEISKELNININTIYRWKKQTIFKEKLRSRQNLIFEDITLRLEAIGIDAVNMLYNLMITSANENTKLKASIFIIDKLLHIRDDEIIRKIEEIEFVLSAGDYKR